jgi:nitrogen fixation protein FixH
MKVLIGFVTLTAILAVAGSFIVGIKNFDGTVSERPYEEGLLWDEVLRKKASLGWSVDIEKKRFTTGSNDITIAILNKLRQPLKNADISVMISRPSTTVYDRDVQVVKSGEGLYRANIDFPLFGYWYITTEVSQERERLPFKKRIFVEKRVLEKADAS